MPIYEFKCESCANIDELLMKISDPYPETCSKCCAKVNKIMSKTSFSLKGTGWYATDYKDASSSKTEGSQEATSEPKKEEKIENSKAADSNATPASPGTSTENKSV